jgi:hypothetical protein
MYLCRRDRSLLAHGKSGPLGVTYDRNEFLEQRRKMMMLRVGKLLVTKAAHETQSSSSNQQ